MDINLQGITLVLSPLSVAFQNSNSNPIIYESRTKDFLRVRVMLTHEAAQGVKALIELRVLAWHVPRNNKLLGARLITSRVGLELLANSYAPAQRKHSNGGNCCTKVHKSCGFFRG